MKTKIVVVLALAIVVLGSLFFALNSYIEREEKGPNPIPSGAETADLLNSTYLIEGVPVTLSDGHAESPVAPGSSSMIKTEYFGNEAVGDLTSDGKDDIAFLVTQSTGGTGLFYYVTVLVATATGYTSTNAFLVGDRIAPQTTEIHEGELHVNFAERRDNEPMTTPPSQGATLLLKVTPENALEGLMK
jgi:hypothetical protein